MKKKLIIGICILLIAVLLIPIPMRLKDGGTVRYTAILYTIEDVHRLNPDINSDQEYLEGTIIKILGMEVFNNTNENESKPASVTFQAEILEVHDGYFLAKPESSWAINSADKIEVPTENMDASLEPEVGDIIEVSYGGEILETYPARLNNIFSIKVIEEADTVSFHDKTFNKADLSAETLEWLEKYNAMSEDEQLAISYIPADLYELCGYGEAENGDVSAPAE